MPRPVEYDREFVLEQATQSFWEKGFCATSISDLVDTTRLNPGSLYGAFHSKEALFLDAIDYYGNRSVAAVSSILSNARSPIEGIRICIIRIGKELTSHDKGRGCFLVNSAMELSGRNPMVKKHVKRHLDAIETLFRNALSKARKAGELSPDKDLKCLAAFLMTSIWGLRVMGETDPKPGRVDAVVKTILSVLS
ncbi:MAG: TetR/AcrR family transcriptional regulator [Acidiferrobacterales bacterium]